MIDILKCRIPIRAVILLAVTSAGCSSGSAPEASVESAATTQDALSGYDLYKNEAWQAWPMPIKVCFTKGLTATPPALVGVAPCGHLPSDQPIGPLTCNEYTELKNLVPEAIAETWDLAPGISFTFHGDCPASTEGFLKMVVYHTEMGGGNCYAPAPGSSKPSATCEFGGRVTNEGTKNSFKGTVVHEVGHALGFDHEHRRTDADNCNASLVAACERCLAAFDANASCSAADWNVCRLGRFTAVTTPQTFATDSEEYRHARGIPGDNGTNYTQVLLTPYDPRSVMNYCSVGRTPGDYSLTAYDLLGAEMAYPVSSAYPIGCASNCFTTGSGAITRTDGAVTTNWTMRGGWGVSLTSPVNGQQLSTLPTSNLTQGASSLSFNFRSPRASAPQLVTAGTLVNSNAVHAALLNATVSAITI